jgi:putative heme-binding domain-containing protein
LVGGQIEQRLPQAGDQTQSAEDGQGPGEPRLKKKAIASATENGRPAELAVDGDLETRWCAPDNGNNYWWQVDLEKPEEITGVRITWEKESAAYQYRISGSADGNTWQTLLEEKSGPRPQMDEQTFSASGIRYVRITVTEAPSGSWTSFFEFEVLGKELVEKPASLFDPRLGGVQSPAGFGQTRFAAAPDIEYPTCLEATPWGDVFVGVDQNGSLDRERGRGWVVRCRDTNGDGEADDFTTFAKMDSPRGLVFDNNTLYVMHPPLLQAFHDDNGDGVSDQSEVLVRGLGKDLDFRGADHTCNGVRLGIDGFLYIALGDYGAEKAIGKDGREVQLYGGGIIRVRLDGSDLEVVVTGTRNTYDVAIDPFMNLFTCDNTNDGDEWNLRLSHMIPTAHYGYPSFYKNFAKEIMPAMNDFGGGSPTGALFLDEPGFPDEFGRGLYTCQWGWNNVSRHPLKRAGATFAAEKETFIRVPRPTGIAADGQGNLYVASWKGATFNYTGQTAGFIARFSDLNNQPTPFPDLRKSSEKELLQLLASSSAVRRLHVQREILRRHSEFSLTRSLGKLGESSENPAVQAAALFTLGQMESSAASKLLVSMSNKKGPLREIALKALANSKTAAQVKTEVFTSALADTNPAVQLQGIIALNRLQRRETAEKIFPFLVDADPAIAHAAFRAMVSFHAIDTCLNSLSNERMASAALRVLGNIHDDQVVTALIAHVDRGSEMRAEILETLCRLFYREGEWDGSWWGTRPDSSGPYYKPVTWEGTERIVAILQKELAANEPTTVRSLLVLFQKYKISNPQISAEALQSLVTDQQLDHGLRQRAFQSLIRLSDEMAVRGILSGDPGEEFIVRTRNEFIRDPLRSKSVDTFAAMAKAGTEPESELAYTVLLHVAGDTNIATNARSVAQGAIASGEGSMALQRAREASGLKTAVATDPSASDKITIAKLPYEDVLKRAQSVPGDVAAGGRLFETTGCVKCHTVAKDAPPTGPFLGDITVRYSATELLESILRPSAKIAQGFETTSIENKDGDVFDGFIVRESGDEVELRNLAGSTIIAKKDIARRGTRPTSIMPDGLVDHVAPEELASLLSYLRSVAGK